jgi:hypothetical protein
MLQERFPKTQLKVGCYGFWEGGNCTQILAARLIPEFFDVHISYSDIEADPDIIFVSVFGDQEELEALLTKRGSSFRIFYSGENKDHTILGEGLLDLSLGFRCPSTAARVACVRFPHWMEYVLTSTCQIIPAVLA